MSWRPDRIVSTAAAALACIAVSGARADDESAGDEYGIEVPEPVEVCLSCHAIHPDEPALEGPLLWQVFGRRIASLEGFEYSAALRKLDGTWDRERLDRFLAAPSAYAPGTRMTLGGVRSASDRKVVVDFLETLAAGAADATGVDDRDGKSDD
jgi:cytochrome c